MKKIDLHNHEAYVLDFFEGRLSAEEVLELKQFLLIHPELNIDLDMDLPVLEQEDHFFSDKDIIKREFSPMEHRVLNYLEHSLNASEKQDFEQELQHNPLLASEFKAFQKTLLVAETNWTFDFKHQLKKTEDEWILNQTVLNYLEGELNAQERLEFEQKVAMHPELSAELDRYRLIKLVPDPSVQFEEKAILKKENRVLPLFRARVVYSAAAAVLLVFVMSVVFRYFLSPDTLPLPQTVSTASHAPLPQTDPTQTIPNKTIQESNPKPDKTQVLLAQTGSEQDTELVSEDSLLLPHEANHLATLDTLDHLQSIAIADTARSASNKNPLLVPSEASGYTQLASQYMVPFEEDPEEDSDSRSSKKKQKGFWNVAIRLAQKANQIGIKSINGNEDENSRYLLSFNNLTIEKK